MTEWSGPDSLKLCARVPKKTFLSSQTPISVRFGRGLVRILFICTCGRMLAYREDGGKYYFHRLPQGSSGMYSSTHEA